MEGHFLEHQVAGHGPPSFRAEPWFSAPGDCIIYQAANEAAVAERVDEVLTIYRSAIDNRPIGYQIKGVMALIRKFGWDGLLFDSECEGETLKSVSIAAMLLAAYEDGPRTLGRRHAYASVMQQPANHRIPQEELIAN